MIYKSPIDIIMSDMRMTMEGDIYKAVQNVGINVDKDELIKALKYDREQYQKGYEDRDAEIVRCKYCVLRFTEECALHDQAFPINKGDDWFCADGKRKEGR